MTWADDFHYADSAVGGVNKRNNVIDINTFEPKGARDVFVTFLRFPEDLKVYAAANPSPTTGKPPSVSKYPGPAYATFVPLDFDDEEDPAHALEDARRLLTHLEDYHEIDANAVRIYFSGCKGFSMEIPSTLFGGFEPSPDIAKRLRVLVERLSDGLGLSTLDTSIMRPSASGVCRTPNTGRPACTRSR